MDGREEVAPGLEAELGESVRALARERREAQARVVHDVADLVDALGPALAAEVGDRAVGGAEEDGRDRVDDDAVHLLRHRPVERPEPGLDVRDRDVELHGRERARERRVGVAEDDDALGPLREQDLLDPRQHARGLRGVGARARVEAVIRVGEPELLEEDRGELAVVVLARVQHDLVDRPGFGVPRTGEPT